MRWVFSAKRNAILDQQRTGLPRRILRLLIERMNVGIGSHLLVIGHDGREVTPFLRGLGMRVTNVESAADISPRSVDSPRSRFRSVDPTGNPRHRFDEYDAVLVMQLDDFAGSVFTGPALQVTASLLDVLQPGGHLVVFQGSEPSLPSSVSRVEHSMQCFARLFRTFSRYVQADVLPMTGVSWVCTLTAPYGSISDNVRMQKAHWTGGRHPLCCEYAAAATAEPNAA